MATLLLLSNFALLTFLLISLLTTGLFRGRKVQVVKNVLNEEAEKLALQRLLRMENSWKGLQACVEQLVKNSS